MPVGLNAVACLATPHDVTVGVFNQLSGICPELGQPLTFVPIESRAAADLCPFFIQCGFTLQSVH